MFRNRFVCLSALALFAGTLPLRPVLADDAEDLRQALALEKTMRKIIAQAEPSIACILVSSKDEYREVIKLTEFEKHPGKLGAFDPAVFNAIYPNEKKEAMIKRLNLEDPDVVPQSFGSGIVIDAMNGLVLTNYHVVRDAAKVFVRLPGKRSSYADIEAADPRSDLAVLRLISKLPNLQPIRLGDGGKLERGQFVLTLANPFAAGFRDGQPSASWGIVSNIRRRCAGMPKVEDGVRSLHQYGTLLQLDARLNLGCSGGAVLNLRGELVALTSAIAAIHGGETPGGFAIPLDAGMRRIVEVLKKGEEVEYGFLGVSPGNSKDFDNRGPGVAVTPIPRSPAQIEGRLRHFDRILEVDGEPINEPDDLFLQLGKQLAGARVSLKVRRATGLEETVTVTLVKLYVPGKPIVSSLGKRQPRRGVRVDYTSTLMHDAQLGQAIPLGVVVSSVQAGSPAALTKLRAGDFITRVNGLEVSTPAEFYQAMDNANGRVELTVGGSSPQDPPAKVVIP